MRKHGEEEIWIGGDFNAHVGKENAGFEGVHGGTGFGDRNEEGVYMLDSLTAMGCCVLNTFFQRKDARLITYESGEYKSAIDMWVVKYATRRKVRNVKIIANEECVQQHRLVVVDWEMSNCKTRKKKAVRTHLKLWKLKDAECKRLLEENVHDKLIQNDNVEADALWDMFEKVIIKGAEEVLGRSVNKARRRETWWWGLEVKKAIEEKRKRFKIWRKARGSEGDEIKKAEYMSAKKEARRKVRNEKEKCCSEKKERLSSKEGRNDIFRIAKQRTKEQKDVLYSNWVKKTDGSLAISEKEVIDRWYGHFRTLLNEENPWDGDVTARKVEGPVREIEFVEVKEALTKMKARKAGGPSEVTADLLKATGVSGVEVLTKVCNHFLRTEKMPKSWYSSEIVPIYKGKGDVMECGSSRGIKLLEHGMKVMESVLDKRIREVVNISEMQYGFRAGRSTTDAIFIARQLQEKFREKDRPLWWAFVDLEKAYDRVPREVVRWALRSAGVVEWLVRTIMAMYVGTKTRVKCGVGRSDWFEINVGLHQGSVLSPLLFTIVLEEISKNFRVGLPWELMYADDLAVAAETEEEMKEKLKLWVMELGRKGLKVNTGKTKIMVCEWRKFQSQARKVRWPCGVCNEGVGTNSILCQTCGKWIHRRCSGESGSLSGIPAGFQCKRCRGMVEETRGRREDLEVDGMRYEVVTNFCYLGDVLDEGGGCAVAVSRRIRAGWSKFRELSGVVLAKDIPNHLKGFVYKTYIRPVAIYGCESWPMRAEEEKRLQRMERKMLRWMVREEMEEDEFRRRLGVEDVAIAMRRNRLRWFGHVERREDTSWLKKVRQVEVRGSRPKGRPRLTWSQVIERDLHEWRMKKEDAKDRDTWRRSLKRPL